MKQDWVDGSVAPMGARSWSSPSDHHSVSVSHGIQLPQCGDLRLGKGLLSAWWPGGGLGQVPWRAHATTLNPLGLSVQEGRGGESSHSHTKAGYSASGLSSAAPRGSAALPGTQAQLV